MLSRIGSEVADARPGAEQTDATQSHAASKQLALAIIEAKRNALLDARDDGSFAAEPLNSALVSLDAEQISIELKSAPPEL